MQLKENISLQPYNTFGINVSARYFITCTGVQELNAALKFAADYKWLMLGGGSNILFTGDYDGVVISNNLGGIDMVRQCGEEVLVKAGAGEVWDDFVRYTLNQGWGGLENMVHIPGKVGASPVQNIGAYGAEVKDVIESVEALCVADGTMHYFSNAECRFGYRDSIFKVELKGKYVITAVVYRLHTTQRVNIRYGSIAEELELMGKPSLTPLVVSEVVTRIRKKKLPEPDDLGSAGSFFKNPVVSGEQYNTIKEQFPGIPGYENGAGKVKVAAGWLIDQCGWKGYRQGDAGVHKHQALVLVNYGNATGGDVVLLAGLIQDSVRQKFDIDLLPEVNIV